MDTYYENENVHAVESTLIKWWHQTNFNIELFEWHFRCALNWRTAPVCVAIYIANSRFDAKIESCAVDRSRSMAWFIYVLTPVGPKLWWIHNVCSFFTRASTWHWGREKERLQKNTNLQIRCQQRKRERNEEAKTENEKDEQKKLRRS